MKAGIVRLNVDGSIDSTFNPGAGISEGNSPPTYPPKISNVAVQRDGKILVVGDFKKFDGVARDGLARLYGDSEPLRIAGFSRVAESRGRIEISGAEGMVEVEAAPALGGPWEQVGSVNVTNALSVEIEMDVGLSENRFFRVRQP